MRNNTAFNSNTILLISKLMHFGPRYLVIDLHMRKKQLLHAATK